MIALHPGGGKPLPGHKGPRTVFERLSKRIELSLGLLGATQGSYTRRQALLDITQGTRVSRSGYDPRELPPLALSETTILGWAAVVQRARSAPTEIVPGLLAASVPGGAAYVGPREQRRPPLTLTVPGPDDVDARAALDAIVAADDTGRIAEVRVSEPDELSLTVDSAASRHQLVVASLPRGLEGDRQLMELIRKRPPHRLLIVVRQPPRSRNTQMLALGIDGLREPPGLLTSRTTRRAGLVAATDTLPTALMWLGIPVPEPVQGRAITVAGERDVAALRRLERRLRVVYPRRFPALSAAAIALLAAYLLLHFTAGPPLARRVIGLAVLWIPAVTLATAALAPSRTRELVLVAGGILVLAFATDRFVRWPRAPAVPALTAITAYCVDLALGSELIVRSLLGPNPRFGSRFFGVGNELEAILPPLLLIGVAAAAAQLPRSRRLAALFVVPMLVLGAIVGSGRLGADVGGVITIAAGAAGAALLALAHISRRALAAAVAAPVVALAALIAADLITGGDAHLSRTVLGADDAGEIVDTIGRRYELAWQALWRGLMPFATVVALLAAWWGVRNRALFAQHPSFGAAFGGSLIGGLAGAASNDSGPILFVLGVVVIGATAAYYRGREDPYTA